MDWFYAISSLLAGLLLLMFAGDWLIGAAVNLGTRWNLSPIFMGTTVVAAGTSLPELVVAVIAQVEGSSGLTLGNVIGSNIFNTIAIIGAASVVAPLPLNISSLSVDLIVMAAMTGSLVLLGSLIKGRLPVKAVGVLLFGTYCWWLIQLI